MEEEGALTQTSEVFVNFGSLENAPIPWPLPPAKLGEGESITPAVKVPLSGLAGSGADRCCDRSVSEAALYFTSPPLGADAPRCPLSDAERGLAERSEAGGEVNEASRPLCFLDGCPPLKARLDFGGEAAQRIRAGRGGDPRPRLPRARWPAPRIPRRAASPARREKRPAGPSCSRSRSRARPPG